MKEREHLLELYEIYSKLLSDRKRSYFEYYYYEDLSLQEIADIYQVSKSYVGKLINSIEKELLRYESVLNINSKNKKIREIIKDIPNDIKTKIDELL